MHLLLAHGWECLVLLVICRWKMALSTIIPAVLAIIWSGSWDELMPKFLWESCGPIAPHR